MKHTHSLVNVGITVVDVTLILTRGCVCNPIVLRSFNNPFWRICKIIPVVILDLFNQIYFYPRYFPTNVISRIESPS